MRSKTVTGLVSEMSGKEMIILTGDGEFIRVPVGRGAYSLGMEVEVCMPLQTRRSFWLSAVAIAAALFMVIALYSLRPALTAPKAYLALDINPSMVFSLDKDAVVIAATALNPDGEKILELIKPEGMDVLEVLDALLEAAYLNNHLATGRENIIVVSLAAAENFKIGEDDLQSSMSKQIMKLKVDTYLKIKVTGLGKVETAKEMSISLNALLLGEEMQDRLRNEGGRFLLEGSPPVPIWEFLQTVNPADIFGKDKLVTGESQKDERKPDIAPQPKDPPEDRDEDEGQEPDGHRPDVIPELPAPEQDIPAKPIDNGTQAP